MLDDKGDEDVGSLVGRGEVLFVKKLFPTRFEPMTKYLPVKLEMINGRIIPTEFRPITHYVPVEFKEIKVPIIIPYTVEKPVLPIRL